MSKSEQYDSDCQRCPRLVEYLAEVKQQQPDYWCKPVPAIGPADAPLLVVGLAPGLHGANRTGRPFSGDQSGTLLNQALTSAGFCWPGDSPAGDSAQGNSTGPGSETQTDCRITNAVKCLPPQNRPIRGEVRHCNGYLQAELAALPEGGVVLVLGRVAHEAVLLAAGRTIRELPFAHGACGKLGPNWLLSSYHCSRYNIQTRRLTSEAFHALVLDAKALLN